MKPKIKNYCFAALIIGAMLMITIKVLTSITTIRDPLAAEIISLILNYIYISGPIVAIIICTGIIVSKIEGLNKKDESGKDN